MQEHSSPQDSSEQTGDGLPAGENATFAAEASELAEYLDVRQRRRQLFPRAALVGLIAGLVAVAFRWLLTLGDGLRVHLIEASHAYPRIGWVAPVLWGVGGALLAVWLVRRYSPESAGSGIPYIKAVLLKLRPLPWKRIIPVKLVGGVVALSSGMALGREGPTVQMGGSVGAAVAEWWKSSARDRLALIAAGSGAGLAAAFNAPLAGLVFVLEELQRDFRRGVFGATFVAAAVADIVTRLVAGQNPVFHIPTYPVPPLTALPVFIALGVITGVLGVLFNKGIIGSLSIFARLHGRSYWIAVAAVGAAAGVVGWFAPTWGGGGHALSESTLSAGVALYIIPIAFIVRFLLTLISYGTGAPGGLFAPLLALGSLIGLGLGIVVHQFAPGVVPDPGAVAVVGMAAYFTAIVRAPLTGIVLIIEMTGNYNLMLPLLVACFCAAMATDALHDLPVYEALLRRDLARTGDDPHIEKPVVIELEIEPDAPFAGLRIRNLGLPPGCIIVRVTDGESEFVPSADTLLLPHMRITAMIDPNGAAGLPLLREGCAGEN